MRIALAVVGFAFVITGLSVLGVGVVRSRGRFAIVGGVMLGTGALMLTSAASTTSN